MDWEAWFERMVIGTFVIAGLAAAVVLLWPFAIGYGIAWILFKLYNLIMDYWPKAEQDKPSEEDLQRLHERIEREALPPEPPKTEIVLPSVELPKVEEREAEEEPQPERKYEEPEERPISLSGDLYLERDLKHWQKEHLVAKGYLRLKISPFGDSGAAYYLVNVRYNESKEHAFFCYILERELGRYSRRITVNTNNGPDLVVGFRGKEYAFDVETGKSLSRQPDYLERKFGHYERDYDQIFILVTNKSLRYKYSRYGYVITRGKLRETLAAIFNS